MQLENFPSPPIPFLMVGPILRPVYWRTKKLDPSHEILRNNLSTVFVFRVIGKRFQRRCLVTNVFKPHDLHGRRATGELFTQFFFYIFFIEFFDNQLLVCS